MAQPTQPESPLLSLVVKFDALPSPPAPHLAHSLIRARRADSELARVIVDGAEAIEAGWVRLRGRLEELEEAILSGPPFPGHSTLAAEVRSTTAALAGIVLLAVKQAEEGGRRSDSTDDSLRRRKIRPNGELHLAAGPLGSPAPKGPPYIQKFDAAYTSYLLATNPTQVLPPGKSLSAALHSRDHPVPPPPPIVDVAATLEARTRRELRDGRLMPFVAALSSPSPQADQTKAWNSLRAAVWDACGDLVPERIKGVETKGPLSLHFTSASTTFDLNAATAVLHALAFLFSTLCAPARDDLAQPLLAALSAPVVPSPKVTPSAPTPSPALELTKPQFVKAVQELIRLADEMKHDMLTFQRTLSSAVDDELLVRMAAWENERSAVLSAYGRGKGSVAGSKLGQATGEEQQEMGREEEQAALASVTESVVRWLQARSPGPANSLRTTWLDPATTEVARGELLMSALLESVFDDKPISFERQVGRPLHLKSNSNFLPAILVIPSSNIFRLQQFVQGIVVVGCLASLARVPLPIAERTDPLGDEWAQRVWALLKPDMDGPSPSSLSLASSGGRKPVEESVKLDDLAEEILRVQRIGRGQRPAGGVGAGGRTDDAEDEVVRGSVSRIVCTQDPVYRLLASRLKDALRVALLRPPTSRSIGVPSSMATGIAVHARAPGGKGGASKRKATVEPLTVKGFARQPLMGRKMAELVEEIRGVLEWSAEVWGDSLRFAIAV